MHRAIANQFLTRYFQGAISNLAVVADTNFAINLTSSETTVQFDVTTDYGDLETGCSSGLVGRRNI